MNNRINSNTLNKIYDTLVRVSNAIVSVINVDITIVDKDLNRITATGSYVNTIGEKIDKSCVFAYALNRSESFIIENPRNHDACITCENKHKCIEYAQVCCPIIVNNETIGIIGLIAFNEAQKNIISCNKVNLLEFLNRMADLIASKVREHEKAEEISLMAKELETVVDSIDIGLISTDDRGNILRYNSIANEMLQLVSSKDSNRNVTSINDFSFIKEALLNNSYNENKEFEYLIKRNRCRGIYNIKPIKINDKITGYIITLSKMKEIIKVVNDVVGINSVTTFDDIIGESKEINSVKSYAKRISFGSSTVLIQGESGTGKELFARAIHFNSDRINNPFIPINCSAVPENLIESELFGYEEGAFTGAKKGGKIGKFELAHKGTIFLDEIGDMPIHMQTKLLRVIQEGVVSRVGGNSLIPIDVRIIAASNKDLEEAVRDGAFREDLYYRLNVIPIHLPPLRERLDDISILSNRFLQSFNSKLNRDIQGFSDDVLSLFMDYHWPGNVRELENVIEYSVNMSSHQIIMLDDLPKKLKDIPYNQEEATSSKVYQLCELERREIIKALKLFGNNKAGIERAAQELGISRATIYRKMKLYSI